MPYIFCLSSLLLICRSSTRFSALPAAYCVNDCFGFMQICCDSSYNYRFIVVTDKRNLLDEQIHEIYSPLQRQQMWWIAEEIHLLCSIHFSNERERRDGLSAHIFVIQ